MRESADRRADAAMHEGAHRKAACSKSWTCTLLAMQLLLQQTTLKLGCLSGLGIAGKHVAGAVCSNNQHAGCSPCGLLLQ